MPTFVCPGLVRTLGSLRLRPEWLALEKGLAVLKGLLDKVFRRGR